MGISMSVSMFNPFHEFKDGSFLRSWNPPAADAGGHSTVNCVITGQIASCWWNDVT